MTVSNGNADATRRIGIYPVTTSWDETQITWNIRRTGVNGRTINVMTTHFDPYTASYRLTQATDLTAYTQAFTANQIIGGDFNDQATNPPIITTMTASFYDAWVEARKTGTAFSAPDNPDGNTRNSRIDYIFYPRRASNLTLKQITIVDTRDAHGVMPSDHRPVLAEFIVK
jgi:endonuclease/exonuclease/phosphatase family metal-dependent hydrolase